MPADLAQLSSLTFGSTTRSTQSASTSLYNEFPLPLSSPPFHSQDTPTLRGGSPSSTMTIRTPDASTRVTVPVDADLLSMARTFHRRSSRLSRWLSELQTPSTEVFDLSDVDPVGTRSNPYLAYPYLNMPTIRHDSDDADSIHDYVVVDDDIALECPPEDPLYHQPSHESAPTDLASPRSTIRLINPPHSLRHFHISRHSVSPHPTTPASRSPSRLSMSHHPSRGDLTSPSDSPSYHSRSTSLQTSLPRNFSRFSGASRASSWRWRPSVLGHFSSASISDTDAPIGSGDLLTDRSRQSISSSNTCSSIITPTTMSTHGDGESPVPSTPPSKPSSLFGSWRLRSHAVGIVSQPIFKNGHGSASSPSLRPLYPASPPHLPQRPSSSAAKSGTIRLSFSPKSRQNRAGSLNQIFIEEPDHSQPHVLFTGKHGGHRLSLSSLGGHVRQAKKKKLVVSGVALNDTGRLEAIQRWCQSFGEIDQITRMPNGDIQISFLKAEVAETVCRVRAQVQIPGAGSVHLSWIIGNKRT